MNSTLAGSDAEFGATWSPIDQAFTPNHPGASRWWDPPGQLRGINLRSWLVLQLADTPGSLTVTQLTDRLTATGLTVNDRPSRAISDALRWETRRGRAIRLERGRYTLGRLARTTHHRMRRRLHACHARAKAAKPFAPQSIAGSGPEPHQVGVRQALELLLSAPVVATTRNTIIATASTSIFTGSRPPP